MIPAEFSFRRAPMYARFGPIQQIAYVVEDIDASIQHWMQFTGVGPWTVYRNTTMLGPCRGIPTKVQMHAALSSPRPEERGLGKECGSTGKSRWSPYQ